MELYGSYTSPFARHCRIALLESGLAFTFVETDAAGSARLSPTQKVPFLKYKEAGVDSLLTDSSAILKLIREKSGQVFFKDVQAFNSYCTANTLLDTAINLFYLEKENLTPQTSTYLARQQSRMETGLAELNKLNFAKAPPFNDSELRIACFLDWALFRKRLTLDAYPNLATFIQNIRQYPHFASTAPKG
jgi:glutathione S-transferase